MRESIDGHLDKECFVKIESESLIKKMSYENGEVRLQVFNQTDPGFFLSHKNFIPCSELEYSQFTEKIFSISLTFLTII